MSMKYLGETFDLHCGGIDLIFPHHENEIAQSQAATGQTFVRHWAHVAHLLIENETMSKSKGNVFVIPDLLARGHKPDAIRYSLIAAHYRSQLNFTWDGLGQAAAALERVRSFLQRAGEVESSGPVSGAVEAAVTKALAAFDAALGDDLNTPEALSAVHVLVGEANSLLAAGEMTREGAARVRGAIEKMDSVLGVLLPQGEDRLTAEEQALFDERQDARRKREFARADEARRKLEALGVVLEDSAKGTRWRRKR
jgi:cysteinyl-tRNA synthetase